MDCAGLLGCRVEEVDAEDLSVKTPSMKVEIAVAVAAAYAVYKEHMVLLIGCLVAWSWMNGGWSIAVEYGVEEAQEALLEACSLVRARLVEAPYRLKPHVLFKTYTHKALHDPLFRSTLHSNSARRLD
jgi:hypothetical protein